MSAVGKLLALHGGWGIEIRRFDGTLVQNFAARDLASSGAVFSPDGQLFAAQTATTQMQIWNVATGESLALLPPLKSRRALPMIENGLSATMTFSSDNSLLARAGKDNDKDVVEVWSLRNAPRRLAAVAVGGPVTALALSPDKTRLFYGDARGTVHWVEIAAQKIGGQIENGLESVTQIVSTAQGLAVLGQDGPFATVTLFGAPPERGSASDRKLWPWRKKRQIAVTPSGYMTGLTISPDGRYVASTSHSGETEIWHLPSGARLQKLRAATSPDESSFSLRVEALTFSPDSSQPFCFSQTTNFKVVAPRTRPITTKRVTSWRLLPAPD